MRKHPGRDRFARMAFDAVPLDFLVGDFRCVRERGAKCGESFVFFSAFPVRDTFRHVNSGGHFGRSFYGHFLFLRSQMGKTYRRNG